MKHTTSFDYMLHFIISSIDLFGFSGKNDITDLRLWNLFISRVCSWSVNKHCTLKTIKSFFFFFFSLWNGFILLRTLKKKKQSHGWKWTAAETTQASLFTLLSLSGWECDPIVTSAQTHTKHILTTDSGK